MNPDTNARRRYNRCNLGLGYLEKGFPVDKAQAYLTAHKDK